MCVFCSYRSPRKPLSSPLRPITTDSHLVFGFDAPRSPLTNSMAFIGTDKNRDHSHTHVYPITMTTHVNGITTTGHQQVCQTCIMYIIVYCVTTP